MAELKELMYSQFGELNRKMERLNDSFVELKAMISKKKPKQQVSFVVVVSYCILFAVLFIVHTADFYPLQR